MPKPSKYNELFSSDIFNQKEPNPPRSPKVQPITHISNTATDIFPPPSNNQVHPPQLRRPFHDHTHSDIFFTESPKQKITSPVRDNINKSTVFSDCKSNDYKVKREKVESNYNPGNYLNFDESNISRHAREFYANQQLDPNFKANNTKGFYNKCENLRNNSSDKIRLDPNKKKFDWNYDNSSGAKFITNANDDTTNDKTVNDKLNKSTLDGAKAKANRINLLQSNIFNDPNKQKYTMNNLKKKDKPVPSNHPDPKKVKCVHTKWPNSKFDWLQSSSELIFKKFDDDRDNRMTAYNRKQKELRESYNVLDFPENDKNNTKTKNNNNINNLNNKASSNHVNNNKSFDAIKTVKSSANINNLRSKKKCPIRLHKEFPNKKELRINVNDNTDDIRKIRDIVHNTSPSMKNDQVRKYMDQVSSVGFDKNFYQRNLSHKNNNMTNTEERQFQIVNQDNNSNFYIDDISVKKMLCDEGIHIYDINTSNDGINRDMKINFKVRENSINNSDFNEKMNNICKKIQNEKGITIQPVQKISVNKRKSDAGSGKEIWDGNMRDNKTKPVEEENKNNGTIRVNRIKRRALNRSNSSNLSGLSHTIDVSKPITGNKNGNVSNFMKNRFSNQFAKLDTLYKNNMGYVPMSRSRTNLGSYI